MYWWGSNYRTENGQNHQYLPFSCMEQHNFWPWVDELPERGQLPERVRNYRKEIRITETKSELPERDQNYRNEACKL